MCSTGKQERRHKLTLSISEPLVTLGTGPNDLEWDAVVLPDDDGYHLWIMVVKDLPTSDDEGSKGEEATGNSQDEEGLRCEEATGHSQDEEAFKYKEATLTSLNQKDSMEDALEDEYNADDEMSE